MKIDTNEMISVSDASNRGLSKLVAEAIDGTRWVVVRNNKPAAMIVGLEAMERLQRIDELEQDVRLLVLTVTRSVTDTGERFDLDEVAREFGVDLDSEE